MRGVPADKSAAMMAPKQKVEKPMRIMGRLFGYILRRYKLHCLGVLLFIFGSTAATVAGNLFMKTLIDDYIVPYIGEGGASDFGPLLAALLKMGCVFLFGVLCTLLYNRIMVYVSQGTMRAIRDDLFRHMERLPIRYFDTHAHGDIMSIYTNDIDTLRQMISQSMPQLVSSAVTIVSVFCSMLALSLPLTGLTLVMVCLMLFTTKKLTSRSGAYFVAQQRNLGTVNGYIEEMMEGQKVVKVFCHEDESIARFDAPTAMPISSCPSWPTSATSAMCSRPSSARCWRSSARAALRWAGWHPFCSSTKASTSPSHRYLSSSTPSSWRWQARSAYSA